MAGGLWRTGTGPVVVGTEPGPQRRPPPWWVLVAGAAAVASVWALQAFEVGRGPDDPRVDPRGAGAPPGFEVTDATEWRGPADRSQWTVSRVYVAADGRGLAFTARSGFRHALPHPNRVVAGEPATFRFGGRRQPALLEWNDAGFAYTIIGMGIASDELSAVADGIVFDWTGVGSTVVPRPGYLPGGLALLDQRAGPSGGAGTGPAGTRVTYQATTGLEARITVLVSTEAVVTAAHLAGLFRFDPGSGRLAFGFPSTGPTDGGLRWLVEDRGATTVTVAATGVSVDELAQALLAISER